MQDVEGTIKLENGTRVKLEPSTSASAVPRAFSAVHGEARSRLMRGGAHSGRRKPGREEGDYDEMDFDESFQDDEEGAGTYGDDAAMDDEDAKLAQERMKQDQRGGIGSDDAAEASDAERESKLDVAGKQAKKLLKKHEKKTEYDSDDSDSRRNPYLSEVCIPAGMLNLLIYDFRAIHLRTRTPKKARRQPTHQRTAVSMRQHRHRLLLASSQITEIVQFQCRLGRETLRQLTPLPSSAPLVHKAHFVSQHREHQVHRAATEVAERAAPLLGRSEKQTSLRAMAKVIRSEQRTTSMSLGAF